MIIINQEQEIIVNNNNVILIAIDESNYKIIYAETIGPQITLGEYETEIRTREVFMELAEAYMKKEDYVMPKK